VHFQKNLKSHIFIFYCAPCQISLSLHQSLCFTYSHSLQFFHPPKVPMAIKNRCTFKNNIKSHIFMFIVRPVRFLYFYMKDCVLPTYTVYNVLFISKVRFNEIGALSKKILNPIFSFFTVRPVRFLYLYIEVCLLPNDTVYNVFFFQSYLPTKKVHFQK